MPVEKVYVVFAVTTWLQCTGTPYILWCHGGATTILYFRGTDATRIALGGPISPIFTVSRINAAHCHGLFLQFEIHHGNLADKQYLNASSL
jgi:hypothetical protein